MENQSLLRKLFLPCTGLLVLLQTAILLLRGIARHIEATHIPEKITSPAIQLWLPLGSFLVLLIAIYLCRKIDLKKIFNFGLILMGLVIISSLHLFNPHISHFLVSKLCPGFLLFLGWVYINQIAIPSDGLKYYFPIYFFAILFALYVERIPLKQISPESPSYPTVLLVMTILCLVLAWICGRTIFKKSSEAIKTDDPITTPSNYWIPAVSVALFVSGLKLIAFLNFDVLIRFLKASTGSTSEYFSYLGKHSLFAGISTLFFLVLSISIGPWILKRKGWKFCILTIIALAAVPLLILSINPKLSMQTLNHTVLAGLTCTWMIPLGQIALLSYSQKDRFITQAYALLVAVPFFEWGIRLCHVSLAVSLFMSFTILCLMAASVILMTKNSRSLAMKVT